MSCPYLSMLFLMIFKQLRATQWKTYNISIFNANSLLSVPHFAPIFFTPLGPESTLLFLNTTYTGRSKFEETGILPQDDSYYEITPNK